MFRDSVAPVNAGRKRVHAAWASAFVVCSAFTAAPAHAQPAATPSTGASDEELKAQAKQRFQQAVSDYDAERYEQALASFQEAYRLRPHPLVNVNIANCYDKLNKPLQAIFHFERFIESDAGTPAQRSEVESALARLRKRVGQLLLRISPDGATVMIDQGDQRRTPILEPIPLEAGHHMIQVRLDGYRTLQRNVTIDGGTTFELSLALEPETAGALPVLSVTPTVSQTPGQQPGTGATTETAPPPSDSAGDGAPGTGPSAGVWVAGALTGVLAVTGIVTGVLALGASSDFDEKKEQFPNARTPLQRIDLYNAARDDADRADALALTTDLLLGGALISGAVTAYLLLADDGDTEQPSALIAPALSARGGGVRVDATF